VETAGRPSAPPAWLWWADTAAALALAGAVGFAFTPKMAAWAALWSSWPPLPWIAAMTGSAFALGWLLTPQAHIRRITREPGLQSPGSANFG
jgi:hypothetical protein